MPGFTTHYLFGREVYHKITCNPQKTNLYRNRAAYGLGLQGPDIFFYYLPSYIVRSLNIGSLAHTQETGIFFRGLLKSCTHFPRKADREIAEAYLTGFLGHYILDTTCHPFIYARTHYIRGAKDYFGRHAYLETDIDTALLDQKLHCLPSEFHAARTISLTSRQKKVIATMLYDAYHLAFPALRLHLLTMHLGIFSIQLGMHLLHDPSGRKKVLLRLAEKIVPGYPVFSPLIANDTLRFRSDPFNLRHTPWTNPWDDSLTSTESFFELYERAAVRYLAQSRRLYALLHSWENADAYERLLMEFMEEYQNLSFHSGLDASIPS